MRARALHDYVARSSDELSFLKDDLLVITMRSSEWCEGHHDRPSTAARDPSPSKGTFPTSYVVFLPEEEEENHFNGKNKMEGWVAKRRIMKQSVTTTSRRRSGLLPREYLEEEEEEKNSKRRERGESYATTTAMSSGSSSLTRGQGRRTNSSDLRRVVTEGGGGGDDQQGLLIRIGSKVTETLSSATAWDYDEIEDGSKSVRLNHQKIARTAAFLSTVLIGTALGLNTLQVATLSDCDSDTYDCEVTWKWDRLFSPEASSKEQVSINYFTQCTNVDSDVDTYGHSVDFLTYGYNCMHLRIGGVAWFACGLAALLMTLVGIMLTMTSDGTTMPAHGSTARFCYNVTNVGAIICVALSLFVWSSRILIIVAVIITYADGMNFHDAYDGHDWENMYMGLSGKVLIAAGALRVLGVTWSFVADTVGASSSRDDKRNDDESDENTPYAPRTRTRRVLCVVFILLGLGLSLVVVFVVPGLIHSMIDRQLTDYAVLKSASAGGYKQFVDRSYTGDDFLYVHAFNITNPHDVLQGAKPIVDEIGPFVYRNHQLRFDLEWNRSEDTLSYRQHNFHVFDAHETKRQTNGTYDSDDVKVITMNMVFQGMQAQIGNLYWHIVCDYLVWENDFDRMFSELTVSQLLEGYAVDVEILGATISLPFPGIYPNYTKKEDDPQYVHKSIMRVGEHNHDDVFRLVQWMGMKSLETTCPWGGNSLPGGAYCPNEWPCCQSKGSDNIVPVWLPDKSTVSHEPWDTYADVMDGTLGEQFVTHLERGSTLVAFTDTAWRKLLFRNVDGLRVNWKGAKLLRYTVDPSVFLNATANPDNRRYYSFGRRGFFANMSIIEQGLTILPSLPHFLHGDERLVEDVIGMRPNATLHETYLDIEPKSGSTAVSHQRAMVSVPIPDAHRWSGTGEVWFPNARHGTIVPIVWFDDASTPTQEGLQLIFTMYLGLDAKRYAMVSGLVLCGLFGLCLIREIVFCCVWWRCRRRRRQEVPFRQLNAPLVP